MDQPHWLPRDSASSSSASGRLAQVEAELTSLRAKLTARRDLWRTERDEWNDAACRVVDLLSQAAWKGQALGRSDCAAALDALLREDAP